MGRLDDWLDKDPKVHSAREIAHMIIYKETRRQYKVVKPDEVEDESWRNYRPSMTKEEMSRSLKEWRDRLHAGTLPELINKPLGIEVPKYENKHRNAGKTAIPVMCIETGAVYDSMKEAARSCNGDSSTIRNAIKKGIRHKGYHWKYV